MGNVPFPPTDPRDEYIGTKYEPSPYHVDCLYAEIVEVWDKMLKKYRTKWYGVDEKLLLLKLRYKLSEIHPELFLPPPSSRERKDHVGAATISSSSTIIKKRKIECGPIIIHGLRIPREVVSHTLPYCDRLSVNNIGRSCRGVYQAIQDRRVVKTIPWPLKCPWPVSLRRSQFRFCQHFVASSDMSRFAVHRKRNSRDIRGEYDNYHIEIWDQYHGLIGEFDWRHRYALQLRNGRHVFSPDGQLLLAPLTILSKVGGLIVFQLPSGSKCGPIIVSEHSFNGGVVKSMSFVNNETISVCMEYSPKGVIDLWEIDRANGRTSLSFSNNIKRSASKVTSFVRGSKTFLALLPDDYEGAKKGSNDPSEDTGPDYITFHDLHKNEFVSKTLPGVIDIKDIAFSQEGKLVATVRGVKDTGELYVFDCKVDTLGEIGQPKYICPSTKGNYNDIIGFSSDGMKVALEFYNEAENEHLFHIVHLQSGEVISDRFLNDDEWDQSAWNSFMNSR